jgi:hypothetical protein
MRSRSARAPPGRAWGRWLAEERRELPELRRQRAYRQAGSMDAWCEHAFAQFLPRAERLHSVSHVCEL